MTDLEIGRISVRCRRTTTTTGEPAQLDAGRAIAHRLGVVARQHLPTVIADLLGGTIDDDHVLDKLVVTIELDPETYDDSTLAMLWGDGIVAAIRAALDGEAPTPRLEGDERRTGAGSPPAEPTALETWLLAAWPQHRREIATILAREPSLAAVVHRTLGPASRALIAGWAEPAATEPTRPRTAAERRFPPTSAGGAVESPSRFDEAGKAVERRTDRGRSDPGAGSEPADDRAIAAAAVEGPDPSLGIDVDVVDFVGVFSSWAEAGTAAEGNGHGADAGELEPVRAELEAHLDLEGVTSDLRWTTSCAGLVVLYPWLDRILDVADDRRHAARRCGLSMVASGGLALVDDPLVGFLASGDPAPARPKAATGRELDRIGDLATGILGRFATVLPGFESSTPDFLRHELILRDGVLESIGDELQLQPTPRPLDVLLSMLPYPISLLRFEWTAPLLVMWERG